MKGTPILVAIVIAIGCGTTDARDAGADAATDAKTDGKVPLDCSKIGCAMPPPCGQPCDAECGCCGCPTGGICSMCDSGSD